jgi:hypothetical protein
MARLSLEGIMYCIYEKVVRFLILRIGRERGDGIRRCVLWIMIVLIELYIINIIKLNK